MKKKGLCFPFVFIESINIILSRKIEKDFASILHVPFYNNIGLFLKAPFSLKLLLSLALKNQFTTNTLLLILLIFAVI